MTLLAVIERRLQTPLPGFDKVTALIWLKKADYIHADWEDALATVKALASGQCGLTDQMPPI